MLTIKRVSGLGHFAKSNQLVSEWERVGNKVSVFGLVKSYLVSGATFGLQQSQRWLSWIVTENELLGSVLVVKKFVRAVILEGVVSCPVISFCQPGGL